MLLDLRELIANPSVRLPFRFPLEEDRLDFPAVKEYLTPPLAGGSSPTKPISCICAVLSQQRCCACATAADRSLKAPR